MAKAPPNDGNRWHVRNGLHSGEIRLIQRALKMYIQSYTRMKGNPDFDKLFERQQMQDAVDAAVRISNRLRLELIAAAKD